MEERQRFSTFGETLYRTEPIYMSEHQALPWSNILSRWKQKLQAVTLTDSDR